MIKEIRYVLTVIGLVLLTMALVSIPWFLYSWAMPKLFPFANPSWTEPPFIVFFAIWIFLKIVRNAFKSEPKS